MLSRDQEISHYYHSQLSNSEQKPLSNIRGFIIIKGAFKASFLLNRRNDEKYGKNSELTLKYSLKKHRIYIQG